MFHLLSYTGSLGVNASNTDLTAATDSEISQRNGHYIFTEQYNMLAAYYFATSATRANFQVPTWNQVTRLNIWPVNRSVNIPSNPQNDWWIRYPPPIPQNEEFQVQGSNNLGAATEQSTCFLWIAPTNWTQNLPQGKSPLPVMEVRLNFTTGTTVANTWSGLGAVTFEQSLRGGTYALVGMQFQGAALQAGRVVFPRAPIWHNRKLRPGVLGSQSIGDVPLDFTPYQSFVWGEFGRFSTFEPPQVEWWSSAGGAIAVEMRWWLVWLSDSMDVQY
jgi:hypothetical protein